MKPRDFVYSDGVDYLENQCAQGERSFMIFDVFLMRATQEPVATPSNHYYASMLVASEKCDVRNKESND